MNKYLKNWILSKVGFLLRIEQRLELISLALGRIEKRQLELINNQSINEWEFQITSQWGEDGIIQFILSKININKKVFIEFGVENYKECNTRFLLQNNLWTGLIIDGSENKIEQLKKDSLYWKYNLKAIPSFITKYNVNNIFHDNDFIGEIGLLSIDIDGNDYWIWEAIDIVSPIIVIAEYNSVFGPYDKISIPYGNDFVRGGKNPMSYYGASIAALNYLANKKGYSLIGGNSAGNNVFFVRNDYASNFIIQTPETAYRKPIFKESRDINGRLTFHDFNQTRESMKHLPVINVETLETITFGDLFNK